MCSLYLSNSVAIEHQSVRSLLSILEAAQENAINGCLSKLCLSIKYKDVLAFKQESINLLYIFFSLKRYATIYCY